MKIKAPAKINLSLDVLKRTASGYHEVQTILQEIPEVHDNLKILRVKESDSTSTVYAPKFKGPKTPIHENDNLVHKALLLIKQVYGKSRRLDKKFVAITITKNIPLSSGLGGASSDAAAILKGLNKLWNLKISQKKLLALAAKLGMDVPFFIIGGTALCTHFGEKITPLPPIKNIKFKISPIGNYVRNLPKFENSVLNPDFVLGRTQTKTASAYSSLDLSFCGKNATETRSLLKALKNKKLSKKSLRKILLANLHNDFETLSPQKNSHHLSGSGPSTFTII